MMCVAIASSTTMVADGWLRLLRKAAWRFIPLPSTRFFTAILSTWNGLLTLCGSTSRSPTMDAKKLIKGVLDFDPIAEAEDMVGGELDETNFGVGLAFVQDQ